MNTVDLVILGFALLMGVWGYSQGLIVGGLSLGGFVGGAVLGSRLGPLLLAEGSRSPYAPLVTLAAAVLAGALLASGAELLGLHLRHRLGPQIGVLDGIGGAALLGAMGLGLAWIAGAALLQAPQGKPVRHDVQRSRVLRALNDALPPSGPLLNALARFDPVPRIAGPEPKVGPPSAKIVRDPDVEAAAGSVVRVLGNACGLNVQGSGWIAADGLVVTNAHVVAGQDELSVQPGGEGATHAAEPIHFDAKNDLAVLRSTGVQGTAALSLDAGAEPGAPAAIAGFPGNGPYSVEGARLGATERVVSQDAYGRGPVTRTMTSFRGRVVQGNSGGPLLGEDGAVLTTIFGASESGRAAGFGVPAKIVGRAVEAADPTRTVGTGPCA